MGQLNGKLGKKLTVGNKIDNNVALHAMFNPEKLAELSGKLGKISLNETEQENGLVLQGTRLPEELVVEILDWIDYRSLIVCQLVCKQWFLLIRRCVWRRKAERLLHRPLPVDEKALWTIFYAICDKKIPFSKNLIKSDYEYSSSIWTNMTDRPNRHTYYVSNKHFKAPKDPNFKTNSLRYIIYGRERCWKRQVIYLLNEGFPQYILDTAKPIIKISEWYRCRRDTAGKYECKIELVKLEETLAGEKVKYPTTNDVIIDSYSFSRSFENRNHRGTWRKFKYEFKNYEKGLNRIRFYHGGEPVIEMGGTTITLEFPSKNKISKSLQ